MSGSNIKNGNQMGARVRTNEGEVEIARRGASRTRANLAVESGGSACLASARGALAPYLLPAGSYALQWPAGSYASQSRPLWPVPARPIGLGVGLAPPALWRGWVVGGLLGRDAAPGCLQMGTGHAVHIYTVGHHRRARSSRDPYCIYRGSLEPADPGNSFAKRCNPDHGMAN